MKLIAFAVILFVLAMPKAGRASSITCSTDFLIGDFFRGEVAGVFSASMATAELAAQVKERPESRYRDVSIMRALATLVRGRSR